MALLICPSEKYSVRVSKSPVILEVFYKPVDRDALDVLESKASPHLWIFFKTNNMKLHSFKKWPFYSDPLIYISVFVPIPYCLDDCGFVV